MCGGGEAFCRLVNECASSAQHSLVGATNCYHRHSKHRPVVLAELVICTHPGAGSWINARMQFSQRTQLITWQLTTPVIMFQVTDSRARSRCRYRRQYAMYAATVAPVFSHVHVPCASLPSHASPSIPMQISGVMSRTFTCINQVLTASIVKQNCVQLPISADNMTLVADRRTAVSSEAIYKT